MQPHPDPEKNNSLKCVVITVSDTRTIKDDDSGNLIKAMLRDAGHLTAGYQIVPDEPEEIVAQLKAWHKVDAFIFNGGTGISQRDRTIEAITGLLDPILPGFGELFRMLSYETIGSRAMSSRAIAGVYREKLVFCLPGSTNGVKLGMEKLIIPELVHLSKQVKQ